MWCLCVNLPTSSYMLQITLHFLQCLLIHKPNVNHHCAFLKGKNDDKDLYPFLPDKKCTTEVGSTCALTALALSRWALLLGEVRNNMTLVSDGSWIILGGATPPTWPMQVPESISGSSEFQKDLQVSCSGEEHLYDMGPTSPLTEGRITSVH